MQRKKFIAVGPHAPFFLPMVLKLCDKHCFCKHVKTTEKQTLSRCDTVVLVSFLKRKLDNPSTVFELSFGHFNLRDYSKEMTVMKGERGNDVQLPSRNQTTDFAVLFQVAMFIQTAKVDRLVEMQKRNLNLKLHKHICGPSSVGLNSLDTHLPFTFI